jgi:hypothetical protein
VEEHERKRDAGARDHLQLAGHVPLEGAVVAQPGERIGDGHLGEALDLGRAGGVEAAAVAHDDGAEEREQQQPHGDRDGDRLVGAGLVAAQRGALSQRASAGGAGLARDDVREDPEDGVDRRVVEGEHALLIVGVDGVEEGLAGAVVLGLQAQEARDGGACGRRAVEREDVVEVGDQPPLGLAMGELHGIAALQAVLALDRLLLGDPVARVLVGGAQACGAIGRGGLAGHAALGDDRERREEAEHGHEPGQAGTDDPAVLVSVGRRHAAALGIRRVDALLDGCARAWALPGSSREGAGGARGAGGRPWRVGARRAERLSGLWPLWQPTRQASLFVARRRSRTERVATSSASRGQTRQSSPAGRPPSERQRERTRKRGDHRASASANGRANAATTATLLPSMML